MTHSKFAYRLLAGLGAAAIFTLTYFGVKADRLSRIGAGYKAKITCSEVFVAGRDAQTVIADEFGGIDPMMDKITVKIDAGKKTARAAGPLGLGRATALYREGYGCTLANGGRIHALPERAPALGETHPWPEAPPASETALPWVDYEALDHALTKAFQENAANNRSVLVIANGKIIGERYADGFTRDTRFLSWSAAKSVTATLVGAAVLRGYLNVDDPAPVAEWQSDPARSKITWNNLLHMQSGLEFEEIYSNPRSDVNRMLFEAADAGGVAAKKRAIHEPGEVGAYSSGTTNLISRTLRQVLAEAGLDFYQFAHDAILDPIGAAGVVLEPDASGTFIGSSFVYATTRDWARLGQLYLQGGVWNGQRLLPEGWSDYAATPASAANGQYGAHFWLNYDGDDRIRDYPGVPEEMYYMSGHEGQYVMIIPSKNMIIVRTGMTRGTPPKDTVAPLIKEIYDAVGSPPVSAQSPSAHAVPAQD